jgi:ribose transport system ATP-binding protein
MGENDLILDMQDISKTFPGVRALTDVNFACKRGEVHALVGENGAGKSTLMKILSGAYQPDKGTIILDGEDVKINDPHRSQQLGISIIYQEFNLIPYLDIAENIFLGREPLSAMKIVDYPLMYSEASELLLKIGVNLDLKEWIMNLTVAEQQMVEIAKALSFKAKVVIMDEPSSALSEEETQKLFQIIRSLKEQGITVIYISHRIKEVFEIADRVTVLKDGMVVATEDVNTLDQATLVRMMIGRTLDEMYPPKGKIDHEEILKVEGLTRAGVFKDISFKIYRGEIVGLAGLIGAGRTEVARAIFGADPVDGGTITINGAQTKIRSPKEATIQGIGLVPEDRRNHGLVISLPVRSNIVLPILNKISRLIFTNRSKEKEISNRLISTLDVKTPSTETEVEYLSGGNQQKVVLSKWLAAAPKIIIFDEPTRGIDVGAKSEIHRLMRDLADKGTGILMISSELPEILGMSDRVVVMYSGKVTAILEASEVTEENVMTAATGIWKSKMPGDELVGVEALN